MLRWHRWTAFASFVLVLYVVATGFGIEFWDLEALTTHAAPTDPNMLMMRQHNFGTPNYAVLSAPDFVAPPLPASLDPVAAITRTARLGHQAAPAAELRLVEVRGVNGHPAGRVKMGERQFIFDLASGTPLPASALPPPEPGRDMRSARSDFKFFHRFNYLGQLATALDGIAAMALAALVVTGVWHYFKLLKARSRMNRHGVFWPGGGTWRKLHRWISLVAALPLLWLATTGFALSVDNVWPAVHGLLAGPPPGGNRGPNSFDGDMGKAMRDSELAPMAAATLRAFARVEPETGIKVLQLRYFAGYAQGVVIAADAASTQRVFNTATGAPMSMTEPGYPPVGFPSGWEGHQLLKRLHRGDSWGLAGRWIDLLGAAGALYLLVSGGVMYLDMWRRRAGSGRRQWLWK